MERSVSMLHSKNENATLLNFEDRVKLNYDHPDALETDLMALHLDRLRHGEAIDCPVYDFAEHSH